MLKRPRRLRISKAMRNLVRETKIDVDDLIYPLFVVEGENIKEEIPSLPDVYHFSVDMLEAEIKEIVELGIEHVIMFGIPGEKDACGSKGYVDNDQTLEYLAKIAVSHAKAGADMVAPSDMMDGRIGALRNALDENGFETVGIMAYSAKYASSFYGPFRDAANSAPSFGDK